MWKPNEDGLKELKMLFKESRSKDNKKQSEIFTKINEYSKFKEFPNYLVYILNSEEEGPEVRQVAGLTLKGIMERSFMSLDEEVIEYFKEKILTGYLDDNQIVRKTIANLINTFIRLGGTEMWPEILNFLLENLNSNLGAEMSLETLNIIIEDSGSYLEDKHEKFLSQLLPQLTAYLQTAGVMKQQERNDNLVNLVLKTIYMLLENCQVYLGEAEILSSVTQVLVNMHNTENMQMRYHLGRCWITIVRIRKEVFIEFAQQLFNFFVNNLTVDYYEMNFISSEFFLTFVDEEEGNEEVFNNEIIQSLFKNYLKQIVLSLINLMRLTPNDIAGLENKSKSLLYTHKTSNSESLSLDGTEETEDSDNPEQNPEGYNPNWTLRKCCSKLVDKISEVYPEKVLSIIKPVLENDMQHEDWLIKERSILALGAIATGAYNPLKPHLSNLIAFLIRELQHPNKLVRAIACWTLSRFTKFILVDNLSDNAYQLFKDYLCEILKKFLDREVIVQEAACTAFSIMVITKKEKLEPYLFDIFKIISTVFNKYTGTSLLTLYDIISLLTESYAEHFQNQTLIEDLVNCVIKRWYEMVKSQDYKIIPPVFDMVCSIIRVSGIYVQQFFDYFLNGSLFIIEYHYNAYLSNNCDPNFLDRELITKSLDLISVLCQIYPANVKDSQSKLKVLDFFFKLSETNEVYLKHYLLALIGDLCKADTTILLSKFEKVINILFVNLEFPESMELEKLSVCNNACWSVGQLALSYPEQIRLYVVAILNKLLKILSLPRLNKSLAQNFSICLGRLALIDPQNISQCLDSFLKQFCLSLRYVKDSPEKREAFSGLCRSILHNPNGVMNFFAFFCDAICQYDDAPEDLENLFQNIILSYKNTLREKWMDYFKLFPDKLKTKMSMRFSLQ